MKKFILLFCFSLSAFGMSAFAQKTYIPSEQRFFDVQIRYVEIDIAEDAMGLYSFVNPAENDVGEYNGDGYIDNIYFDMDDDGDISIYSEFLMGEEEVPTNTSFVDINLEKSGFTCKTEEVLSFLYDSKSMYSGKFAEIIYTSKGKQKKTNGFIFSKPTNNDQYFYEKMIK
ncbi:MAG TPA: hypothetical protein VIL99_17480 [Ignavibacteria bacterium]